MSHEESGAELHSSTVRPPWFLDPIRYGGQMSVSGDLEAGAFMG